MGRKAREPACGYEWSGEIELAESRGVVGALDTCIGGIFLILESLERLLLACFEKILVFVGTTVFFLSQEDEPLPERWC